MNRLQRATERAEREGLLTWSRDDGVRPERSAAVETVPVVKTPVPPDLPVAVVRPVDSAAVPARPLNASLVAATDPESFAADQYQFLRTRLLNLENGAQVQTLLVTSPGSGDGKTTTSANLALTMARDHRQKVVLVEGDVRRPTLATLFGVPSDPGLVDVLMGTCSLDEALVEIPGQTLFLLPAGPGVMPSTELFASSMMQRALRELRGRFNRIIVDAPPATTAETYSLARLADRVLLVVRAGVTPRPALSRALAVIDQQRVLGIVLNEVDTAADSYGYGSPAPRGSRP
jgi:capsular exopolysaccharide synthesis family protein